MDTQLYKAEKLNQGMAKFLSSFTLWYHSIPFMRMIPPLNLIALITGVLLALLTRGSDCTCAEQIPDTELQAMASKGNQKVRTYLAKEENAVLCASMRAELLRKLEKEKIRTRSKE